MRCPACRSELGSNRKCKACLSEYFRRVNRMRRHYRGGRPALGNVAVSSSEAGKAGPLRTRVSRCGPDWKAVRSYQTRHKALQALSAIRTGLLKVPVGSWEFKVEGSKLYARAADAPR